ncbi:polysaccharide lyase family 7 protein [Pontixanthobacter sp. CEM42]|uniref:polysaccharide lyase family 7 protein n=1 Tax=Pontixanthobacter sp. CEM42 TaxID=2792077 RepID=UPI001ADF4EC0|nr:polysaccharide lyase family 7 protein [Pontixanthobacter sp. CEM42]
MGDIKVSWPKPKFAGSSALVAALLLTGCGGGGGGGSTSTPISTPSPSPTPTPTPTPTQSCSGLNLLEIAQASSDQASGGLVAANTIDDNLDDASRWSAPGIPAALTLDLGQQHLLREVGIAWHLGDQRTSSFTLEVSNDGTNFISLQGVTQSAGNTLSYERYDVADTSARFVRISGTGTSDGNPFGIVEAALFGCSENAVAVTVTPVDTSAFGLNPNVAPGQNFELIDWALDTPAVDPSDGFAQRTQDVDLANFSDQYFFTASDGGMVFRSTIDGATTSANSTFTRSELREMLRRGNRSISTQGVNQNNWLLGYQPDPGVTVGGRGGVLKGTLAINHVSTTGSNSHIGRMVFGQIHASSDEPIRLYYKKFPGNVRGYVYFAHEIRGADDIYFMVVGPEITDRDRSPVEQADPLNGIALNEVFSYEIINAGARIDVIIRRGDQDGEIIGHNFVDMTVENSGYDTTDEWNYFKAGVYTQNNTGDAADFDQATFYRLSNTHN